MPLNNPNRDFQQDSILNELSGEITNLSSLSDSHANRIAALEALITPKILWRSVSPCISLSTTIMTVATYTIEAGVVDNSSRILCLEAGFSTSAVTGSRTILVSVGSTTIWTGTLAANTSTPVRKIISFDVTRQSPRCFNTTNNGYAQTTTAPLINFADFRQAQTINIKASTTSSTAAMNIDYVLLTMV